MTGDRRDILIISMTGLRPFMQALPAMAALRAAHVGARVTLLTDGVVRGLACDAPYFNEVVEHADLEAGRGVSHLAQVIKRAKFAMIYDFDRDAMTERLFAAMRPFPPPWCGAAPGGKYQYAPPADRHPTDAALDQIAVAGVPPHGPPVADLTWVDTARRRAPSMTPQYFRLREPYVLLAPAAMLGEPDRIWPTARFGGLAACLIDRGLDVALVADGADKAAAQAARRAHPEVVDLSARADLTQAAALARGAACTLGHAHSGVTHLFAAAGAPTISLEVGGDAHDHDAPRGSAVTHRRAIGADDVQVGDVAGEIVGRARAVSGRSPVIKTLSR